PNQALATPQPYLANRVRVQAHGRHQHVFVGLTVDQIDRADVDTHGLRPALDNDAERVLEPPGLVDLLHDAVQGVEHRYRRHPPSARTVAPPDVIAYSPGYPGRRAQRALRLRGRRRRFAHAGAAGAPFGNSSGASSPSARR